ncbi:vigilin [Nephila pilipes]|uniref:Vigilin n=1 Tax=Nephila pilipes TaxID=299642 RepID=A0A8X6MDV2_NEPPI|nr:vigilin [Nephila pilipes]
MSTGRNVHSGCRDVSSWLHKNIIGKKGANIKHATQDLSKVQVDFTDESIKVEGSSEEVYEACKRLKEIIDNIRKQVAYEKVKVNPAFRRHVIGKNGSNINRLKEDIKILINIPSDKENYVVRIEGASEGVAQVEKLLLEMVHKMEREISKDLIIEQRFHQNIIGAKSEKVQKLMINLAM